jgi:hypothetical protein
VGIWDYLSVEKVAPSNCQWVWVELESLADNVGAGYFDNVELLLAPAGLETDSSIWAVTTHHLPMIAETLDVGAGHQRFDLRWVDLEPQENVYDWGFLGARRTHLRTASELGVDLIAVTGGSLGTGSPTWVNEGNFATSFYWFCRQMGQQFGASVYWYQLANEQNHFYHSRFDDATVFNQCFAGLSDSDSSSNEANHAWFFRSIVNAITYPPSCWSCDLEDWLGSAGGAIDVVAIDHYPGEVFGGPADGDWSNLVQLGNIAVAWNKFAAVMETGRSTTSTCDDSCQSTWVNFNIRDQVRPIAAAHNTDHWNNRFVLLAWYKLRDSGGETNGLQREDGTPRPAYATFRAETIFYDGPPFYS